MARKIIPQFEITPMLLQGAAAHGEVLELQYLDDYFSPDAEVYLFSYLHECEPASEDAGYPLFHLLVEIWDVRNPAKPYFVSVQHPENQNREDGHYTQLDGVEQGALVLSALIGLVAQAPEPGQAVKAFIAVDTRIAIEREQQQQSLLNGLRGIFQDFGGGLNLDDEDIDDEGDALPGVFGSFNPFGN